MIKLPKPPEDMTWEEIRKFVIDTTGVANLRNLNEWRSTYRSIIRDRLKARQPVRKEVVDAFYRDR